jgi:phosphoenolpyruvate-protein kinase (PTS system EI component)
MKKSIFNITLILGAFLIAISSCSTPAEKVEKAEDKVTEAKNNLDSAIKDYQTDINTYRLATAERIAANEKSIKEFNLRIANDKKEAREEYLKKINALEKKNTDMKKRLDDYKADGNDKWKTFKMEFSKEMDDLGNSIKDLTSKH